MSYNQRETPILAELCTFLVEDVYGELAARVYSILARHGRQTLSSLTRASYLTSKQVKNGLIILVQQHLIFFSGNDAPVTHYEIDWQQSYALVRLGKIAKLVEDRFGKKAANVVSNLQALGHTRIGDLKVAYFPPEVDKDDESDDEDGGATANGAGPKKKHLNGAKVNEPAPAANGVTAPAELQDEDGDTLMNGGGPVNGVSENSKMKRTEEGKLDSYPTSTTVGPDDIASPEELYDIIRLLIERGWVKTVTDTQYLSPGDMHTMLQQEAIDRVNNGAAVTGTKDKEKVHRETQMLKREMRDEWLVVPKLTQTHKPQKRPTEDNHYNDSTKRQKMNGDQSVPISVACASYVTTSPEDNLVVRVNLEKIAVAMRTEQLVQLVEQRIGFVTAHVYQTMLRMIETNTPRCYEEWPEPPVAVGNGEVAPENHMDPRFLVTARDVAKKLSRDLDVCEGLDPNTVVAITLRGHVHRSGVLTQPVDPDNLSVDHKTQLVDRHIRLLAEDPLHFATWHARAGFSQWQIEFDEIAKQLIQTEIENTISARKGALGIKLIRALRKKGKLDERATCNAMMMSANDIRGIVNDLTVQGFVQTQEIPKVERREAKHSLHLVWYDRQRAREKLLHDTYKGMVRILQRIAFERSKVQSTLTKAERSDVQGNEAKYLSTGELQTLKKWKEIQEKLTLQLLREDELVATLRDFHGALISV